MITDVDHSMKVMRDETFGPVVGIMKVRDADEAVRLANDTRYGLAASVFGSKREAEAVARRLEVGTANVNDVLVGFLASDVPMGGWKDSGIGFRHGDVRDQEVRPSRVDRDQPLRREARAPLLPLHGEAAPAAAQAHRLLQRSRLAPATRHAAASPPRSAHRRAARASCSNHSETSRSQATSDRVLIRT